MRLPARTIVAGALGFMAAAALAACGGSPAPRSGTAAPGRVVPGDAPKPPPVELSIAAYAGAFADDAAVRGFAAAFGAAASEVLPRLRDEAGLGFLPDRTPLVTLVDGATTPPQGGVVIRVVDGVRRPEIRVRAGAVAAGEFRPGDDAPPLLVEAALLATAGERAPPPWVREGVGVHLGGTLERRLLEIAVAHPGTSFPVEALEPLDAAFRTAALARIAVGERPIRRYLEALLAGADASAALASVGVGDVLFLDAAAETERDRAHRDIVADERLTALRAARRSVLAGEADAAEALLRMRGAPDSEGRAGTPAVEAEMRLVAAEAALVRGEGRAADDHIAAAFADAGALVRVRDARWLSVRAGEAQGDVEGTWGRLAAFTRWFPDDVRVAGAAGALGVDAAALRAIVAADPAERAAAATAVGGARVPGAVAVLRPALRDGHVAVRRASAAALGRMAAQAKSAAEALDRACGDPEAAVRGDALAALTNVDPARAVHRAAAMRSDPDAAVRAAAERLLGIGAPPPVQPKPTPQPAEREPRPEASPARPTAPTAPPPTSAPPAPAEPPRTQSPPRGTTPAPATAPPPAREPPATTPPAPRAPARPGAPLPPPRPATPAPLPPK